MAPPAALSPEVASAGRLADSGAMERTDPFPPRAASAGAPAGEGPLVYDLGLHKGEDSEFYLKKGFRVVAVEADPALSAHAAARLRPWLEAGRLVILNLAIAETAGARPFYRHERSEWGTLNPDWAQVKRAAGAALAPIEVETVPLERLLAAYGEAYYLKIDIEGMDLAALESLARTRFRPKYLSVEASAPLEAQFALLTAMGYDAFKIVQQRWVKFQRPPRPALEGAYVEHRFPRGASGLFGEEAPGRWLTAEEALRRYRRIFERYRRFGDSPGGAARPLRTLLHRLRLHPGWHDTHARHGGG
jgi:FkbM family methyltransferase